MHLLTADGVRLAARVLPGPDAEPRVAVVLAHGFGVSTGRAPVVKVARGLARHALVLAYDARGHGRSTGRTTLGDREVLDVDAAVAAARRLAPAVVTVGFSMGGAAVVRHAGLRGQDVAGHLVAHAPDAVVAVSTTASWSERATAERALRRLHAVVETRPGRAWARAALRTRVSPAGWDPVPASPLELAPAVAPLPLLVVHGDRDGYFPVAHAQALAAACPGAELWLEPGFGHAETAAGDDLLDRLGARAAGLAVRTARS
ncbi:MAG TPA: alpha/beta fold hydrolase [Mycobacteriales bacterium]|nr:alpha/beta fold hydrolase [Mycobacteriales bacterium]